MGKLTDLRNKIDEHEHRLDAWLDRLRNSPHTSRMIFAVVFVLVFVGLMLWL